MNKQLKQQMLLIFFGVALFAALTNLSGVAGFLGGLAGILSPVFSGLLLAFVCPVTIPYWTLIIGDFFAIIVVKQLFGGIGQNFMNPALAARAFLFSWPVLMATWVAPGTALSVFGSNVDAVTSQRPWPA